MSPNTPASVSAWTQGALRKLIITVSAYHTGNPCFEKALDSARKELRGNSTLALRIVEACRACHPVWDPGIKALHELFDFLRPWQNTKEAKGSIAPVRMFGVFEEEEPSLALEVKVPQQLVNAVKLATIEFGERLSQKNVHLTESMRGKPVTKIPELLLEGETWETAYLFKTGEMLDIFTARQWAGECGLPFLSLSRSGNQILVYSIGNQTKAAPTPPEALREFRKLLKRRCHKFEEKSWHLKLSNFGNKEDYLATHTYDEARSLLTNRHAESETTGTQVEVLLRKLRKIRRTATVDELLSYCKNLDCFDVTNRGTEKLLKTLKDCGLLTVREQPNAPGIRPTYHLTQAGRRIHDRTATPAEVISAIEKLASHPEA